jgi:hypothetical protein
MSNNYRLNRMIGKTLPSAISQAQILAAIVDASVANGRYAVLARAVFKGIAYDYYAGGVNLHQSALLEIPLFRSAPEIVLNGWLHALILVHHYAEWSGDPEARALLRSNVSFLTKIIDRFHDQRTGLSLYSDLGPYRVDILYEADHVPQLYVYYDSEHKELDDIVIPLEDTDKNDTSRYDNHIAVRKNGSLQAWINCSQNYGTYLVSGNGGIEVSLSTGQYDPKRATPDAGGSRINLASTSRGKWQVVDLASKRNELYCGFPTNFAAKSGKENYYHIYHIVALAYILATFDLEEREAGTLERWMETWCDTIGYFEDEKGMRFSDFGSVLAGLATFHREILYEDWGQLLTDVKERWGRRSSACG